MTKNELARMIDHTQLKPEATARSIDRLCDEAMEHGFVAVCVNPIWVARCARRLAGSGVKVAGVIGFPLGASVTPIKVAETRRAIEDGASEIDMVLRVGDLVAGETSAVRDDIAAVSEAVHAASPEYELKVIFETAVLNEAQIVAGCRCCIEARADFVKTSTGFHPKGGATVHAVELLHRHADPLQVKAAGGIRNWPTAKAMIQAGASRLGCSIGPKIMGMIGRLSL